MTTSDQVPEGFDLDEDGTVDTVAVDTDADQVPELVAFDLDEDGTPEAVAVDTDADGTPDLVAYDLDEDSVADQFVAIPDDQLPDDGGDQSIYTPPEDISNDDVQQASDDLEHTELMGQYMQSRGVIDSY